MSAMEKRDGAIEGRIQDDCAAPISVTAPYDARFRRLLGEGEWARLPTDVQRRLSKRADAQNGILYRGAITTTRHSVMGWVLAQMCRIIGAPLPLFRDDGMPALVIVSEDRVGGGQCWTRIYERRGGFPQVIQSAKRFTGVTGLEEYLGFNVGMALQGAASSRGVTFTSDHYFIRWGERKIRLPRWLSPGRTTVEHRDLGEGEFAFILRLEHALLGELIYQSAVFRDG